MTDHTQTPWTLVGKDKATEIRSGSRIVCDVGAFHNPADEADAGYIVRCVNAHQPLLEAVQALIDGISVAGNFANRVQWSGPETTREAREAAVEVKRAIERALVQARAALALARA